MSSLFGEYNSPEHQPFNEARAKKMAKLTWIWLVALLVLGIMLMAAFAAVVSTLSLGAV